SYTTPDSLDTLQCSVQRQIIPSFQQLSICWAYWATQSTFLVSVWFCSPRESSTARTLTNEFRVKASRVLKPYLTHSKRISHPTFSVWLYTQVAVGFRKKRNRR
ncbi:unnamed protein product, partial [Ectocarpus fasciculatus]